jgi:hypothetical protein
MVLYQICVFGADLKSNMAARVHNVFSLAEILKIFLSETTKSIELWTDAYPWQKLTWPMARWANKNKKDHIFIAEGIPL